MRRFTFPASVCEMRTMCVMPRGPATDTKSRSVLVLEGGKEGMRGGGMSARFCGALLLCRPWASPALLEVVGRVRHRHLAEVGDELLHRLVDLRSRGWIAERT